MLLTQVKAYNSKGDVIELPLSDGAPIHIRSIDGLGPVRATISSTGYAKMDGAQYHSSRREPRNLVFRLGLDPDLADSSVFYIRNELYKFFMPKTQVRLEFHLFDKFSNNYIQQNLVVESLARVETNEPNMFSSDPGVDISVICFDPAFIDPNEIVLPGSMVDDLTEFTIDYAGTVETGVLLEVVADRIVTGFTVYQILQDETLRTAYFNQELEVGAEYKVSSEYGNKFVTYKTALGVESRALYTMSPQSDWIVLQPGLNRLRVYTDGTAGNPFEIKYTNKYGGL